MTNDHAFLRAVAIAEQLFGNLEVLQSDSRHLANELAVLADNPWTQEELPAIERYLADRSLRLADKVDSMFAHIKPFLTEIIAVEQRVVQQASSVTN